MNATDLLMELLEKGHAHKVASIRSDPLRPDTYLDIFDHNDEPIGYADIKAEVVFMLNSEHQVVKI